MTPLTYITILRYMAKGKVEKKKKAIYSEVPKVDLAPIGMKLFIS